MVSPRRSIADDRAVHPLLTMTGFLLVTVASFVTAYGFSPAFSVDQDEEPLPAVGAEPLTIDGRTAWIELVARSDRPVDAQTLDVRVVGPDGDEATTVCRAPNLGAGGPPCAEPLQASHTFSRTEALWIPCTGEGVNKVAVTVDGSAVLRTDVECSTAAPAG